MAARRSCGGAFSGASFAGSYFMILAGYFTFSDVFAAVFDGLEESWLMIAEI